MLCLQGVTGVDAPAPSEIVIDWDTFNLEPRKGYRWRVVEPCLDFRLYLEMPKGVIYTFSEKPMCQARYGKGIISAGKLAKSTLMKVIKQMRYLHKYMPGLRWYLAKSYLAPLWISHIRAYTPSKVTVYRGNLQLGYLHPVEIDWYNEYILCKGAPKHANPLIIQFIRTTRKCTHRVEFIIDINRDRIKEINRWAHPAGIPARRPARPQYDSDSDGGEVEDNDDEAEADRDNDDEVEADSDDDDIAPARRDIGNLSTTVYVLSFKQSGTLDHYLLGCPLLNGIGVTIIATESGQQHDITNHVNYPAAAAPLLTCYISDNHMTMLCSGPPADEANLTYDGDEG